MTTLCELTALNGRKVFVNPQHVTRVTVAARYKTVIEMVTGKTFIVKDPIEEVIGSFGL